MIKRPKSCASLPINLVGLLSFIVALAIVSILKPQWSAAFKVVFVLVAIALPIILLEFRYKTPPVLHRVISSFSSSGTLFSRNWSRVFIKLLALYFIFSLIAFIYWVFPEYRGRFYDPFWGMLLPTVPWLIGLAIPYYFIVDEHMEQPEDGYYVLGMWLLRQGKFERKPIVQLLLAWLVKLFFLPLMIVYFTNNILAMAHHDIVVFTQSFQLSYNFLWLLFFTIDLAFTCVGYVLTLRILDSHIRSTEPTALGWGSALICYQPFFGGISALYFAYNMDNYEWGSWLSNSPALYTFWGLMILICLAIYALATVMFGIRFSNLTNRGIITNGPYRFVKHPAYLSKNLSWWLVAVPFVSQSNDITVIIRSCFMLLFLNLIYYIRAKTEERHLMSDPDYRAYCEWIAINGSIAKIKKKFGLIN